MIATDWQDIASAPKDGTDVLLWIDGWDVPVVGNYTQGRWRANTEHYEVSCVSHCYGGSVSSYARLNPGHWAPAQGPQL